MHRCIRRELDEGEGERGRERRKGEGKRGRTKGSLMSLPHAENKVVSPHIDFLSIAIWRLKSPNYLKQFKGKDGLQGPDINITLNAVLKKSAASTLVRYNTLLGIW